MQIQDAYNIRPSLTEKFKQSEAELIIKQLVHEKLQGVKYEPETATDLSKSVASLIQTKLTAALSETSRYKFVVSALVGEMKGEGVRMDARCIWDPSTDNYASFLFKNDSLFCNCSVFAVYCY